MRFMPGGMISKWLCSYYPFPPNGTTPSHTRATTSRYVCYSTRRQHIRTDTICSPAAYRLIKKAIQAGTTCASFFQDFILLPRIAHRYPGSRIVTQDRASYAMISHRFLRFRPNFLLFGHIYPSAPAVPVLDRQLH